MKTRKIEWKLTKIDKGCRVYTGETLKLEAPTFAADLMAMGPPTVLDDQVQALIEGEKTIGKMKYFIAASRCNQKVFCHVNGVPLDTSDFGSCNDRGSMWDKDSDGLPCCVDYGFEKDRATNEVLEKYGIDLAEYDFVCEEIGEVFNVGSCSWCY